MSEESIMIITGGNASVDFESWDKSIADENSNLHLVSYGPRAIPPVASWSPCIT